MIPLFLDLETCAHPLALNFLEPVKAPKNLKDPAKIQAAIEEKEYERAQSLALDPYTTRIVAIGTAGYTSDPWVTLCHNEDEERENLVYTWNCLNRDLAMCGYCIRTYDLRVLVTRSRLLGVTVPRRFRNPSRYADDLIDLYDLITFGDERSEACMSRKLTTVCRRFGIDIPDDDIKGKDVAQAIADGRWDDIGTHVTRDVLRTRELAKRLGV